MCDARDPRVSPVDGDEYRVLIEDDHGGRWQPTVRAMDTQEAKRLALTRAIEQGLPHPTVLTVTPA